MSGVEINTKTLTAGNHDQDQIVQLSRSEVYIQHIPHPILPILGFWGSEVLKNMILPAQDADEPLCKI